MSLLGLLPPVLLPLVATAGSCSTALDCSLGGLCVGGVCQCDAAFKGPNCAELNLLPARKAPLLDIGSDTASWGGFPVYDSSDKLWHLFYAE